MRALESHGHDPADFLGELGIQPATLLSARARIPLPQALEVLERARERSGDPAFALVAGTRVLAPDTGLFALLGQSSRSISELMSRIQRYSALFVDGAQIDWRIHEGRVEAFVDTPLDHILVNEAWAAAVVTLVRALVRPDYHPHALHFSHAEPAYRDRYEALFRCQLSFGAERCVFVGTSWGMRLTADGAHDPVSAALEQQARVALGHSGSAPMSARVRTALMERMPDRTIDSDAISRQLGLSRSSLHRELQREGVSFKQVLNETRRELAHQYLQDPLQSLDEVADRLGFADRRAFTRAFKRWEGVPPSQARPQS
ncbi:MAG: AraC family transcriptional regulator [Myxococcales bacterium]|nr:AraC family transcriptional regulator [Myxococcales bacterium]